MTERPLTLSQTARRYGVRKLIIVRWAIEGFIPKPDFIDGEPYWWPGCLEAHDLIVWSNGGRPDLGKINFQRINYHANRRGMHPFGKRKKRGRPRLAA